MLLFRSASASRTWPSPRYHGRPACFPDNKDGKAEAPSEPERRVILDPLHGASTRPTGLTNEGDYDSGA
jgi:hypothetical protein